MELPFKGGELHSYRRRQDFHVKYFDGLHRQKQRVGIPDADLMANYKIHMRSLAPWREFGQFAEPKTTICTCLPRIPPSPIPPSRAPRSEGVSTVTAQVLARDGRQCDGKSKRRFGSQARHSCKRTQEGLVRSERRAYMLARPTSTDIGTPSSEITVDSGGTAVRAVIAYAAPNP